MFHYVGPPDIAAGTHLDGPRGLIVEGGDVDALLGPLGEDASASANALVSAAPRTPNVVSPRIASPPTSARAPSQLAPTDPQLSSLNAPR